MKSGGTRALLLCLAVAAAPRVASAEGAGAPVRPTPFKDDLVSTEHPRTRHLSLGASLVMLDMPSNREGDPRPARAVEYAPTIGAGVDLRFPLFRYLDAGVSATFAVPSVEYARDALGVEGAYESEGFARVEGEIRLYPMLPLGRYVALFAIVGGGFGRLEFPEVGVRAPEGYSTTIAARGASFFTLPLGVGASLFVIPRWLSVDLSLDVAPMFYKDGDAFVPVQVLEQGRIGHAGALPHADATYRQSLGVSLIL
ncbi:MAG: hypothetical protein U0414_01575 [Polyangiaceae bacterium]